MKQPTTFKSIYTLFSVLLVGQVFLAVVIAFLIPELEIDNVLRFTQRSMIVLATLVGAGLASFLVYRRRIKQGASLTGLPVKLEHYRASNIIRWAILEGVNLLIIVIAFLESYPRMLWFLAPGLAIFLRTSPSKEGFINDYQLTAQEQSELG